MTSKLLKKCINIKILLTDVDGVLTDGGMYYSAHGDVMKKFNAKDGMGINILRKKNIPTIIITKEKTKIIKQWAKKMNGAKLYDGIKQKELMINTICSKYKVKPEELAYIGDDINDIELLKRVGLSAAPADSIKEVRKICNYVCKTYSGFGVLREVCDLILSKNNSDPYFWEMKGQMTFESGDAKGAIKPYQTAVSLLPGNALIRRDLGRVQLELNDPALLNDAIVNLRAATIEDPESPFTWRQLAIAYGRQGDKGHSSLALAEEALLLGKKSIARYHGGLAERLFPKGSREWLHAQDILTAARHKKK